MANKKYIEPLCVNDMRGYIMRLPGKKDKTREILLLYGHHASLERMSGIAEVLNKYGSVTVPDLPGFGGMDSFYKIGKKPTLDNYADYLAALIKLRYKHRRFTIVAMSFSFLIVTRMLQRYPELAKKVDILVSFVGFVHRDDFHVKPIYYWTWRVLAAMFGGRIGSAFFRYVVLQPWIIRLAYSSVAHRHPKLHSSKKLEQKRRVDFEIKLWHINDVRTRMKTLTTMLTVDLCNARVNLPVYHVSVAEDFYFDNNMIEQHMRIVYKDFESIPANSSTHAPTIIATAKEAASFVPKRLQTLLKN